MKNIENMNVLGDMEMAKVAGGYDDDHTIFDTFVEWLIQLPTNYPDDLDKIPLIGKKNHQLNNAESG